MMMTVSGKLEYLTRFPCSAENEQILDVILFCIFFYLFSRQHMRDCTLSRKQLFQDILSYDLDLIGCSEKSTDEEIVAATGNICVFNPSF